MKKIILWLCFVFVFSISILIASATTDLFPLKQVRIFTQDQLQNYLDQAKDRYLTSNSTVLDKGVVWVLTVVGTGTIGWLAPEAQKIMLWYVYGNGDLMIHDSDYYSKSMFLKKLGKKMKNGDKLHNVWVLPTSKDYRLAMAVNGFDLTKKTNTRGNVQYTLYRRIHFPEQPWAVFTFYIGKYKIKFYDMLVHLMRPTPFDYQVSWTEKNDI